MTVASGRGLAFEPRWLGAVVHDGLVFVRHMREVSVELPRPAAGGRLLDALVSGVADDGSAASAAGLAAPELEELCATLAGAGALAPEPADAPPLPPGRPLAEAVLVARAGGAPDGLIWTGDELLHIPSEADPRDARRAVRFLIAGATPHGRVRAYGQLASMGGSSVAGDRPDAGFVEAALAALGDLDPSAFHVIGSKRDGAIEVASCDAAPGAREPHRLGPVLSVGRLTRRGPRAPRGHLYGARYAHPNLLHPGSGHGFATGVHRTDEQNAKLVARAEAVERFAAGDISPSRLVRSRAGDLPNAVLPAELHAYNERQLAGPRAAEAYRPDTRYLWIRAETATGEERMVPAASVMLPFTDPDAPPLPRVTSSGMAVHPDRDEARRRALAELVERDAFMWTWLRRESPPLISTGELDGQLAEHVEELDGAGLGVTLLDLTLDTWPVVLCLLDGGPELAVGASCAATGRAAASRALVEASTVLWRDPEQAGDPPQPEQVLTALDHLEFQRSPLAGPDRAFLTASRVRVPVDALGDSDEPLERALARISEPLFVDLTSRETSPFHAVRALVPGLVPMTFGYDREPFGMPRLARPIRSPGRDLDLATAGPILPHPFP